MIQVKLFEIVIIFTHNAIILLNQKYSDEYFLHVSVGTILFTSNIQSNLSNEKVVRDMQKVFITVFLIQQYNGIVGKYNDYFK
jgi:hypothetical protein